MVLSSALRELQYAPFMGFEGQLHPAKMYCSEVIPQKWSGRITSQSEMVMMPTCRDTIL
jgi:hypothetical protein